MLIQSCIDVIITSQIRILIQKKLLSPLRSSYTLTPAGVYWSVEGACIDYSTAEDSVVFCLAAIEGEEEDYQRAEEGENCLEQRAKYSPVHKDRGTAT